MTNATASASVDRPEVVANPKDSSRYPSGIAYMEGEYLPISQAKISVLDWGLLHSDATYDTVHVWDGHFFRLDLHLERFFNGLEKLRMNINLSREEVTAVLKNCVGLSGHRSAYVEMLCTRGSSPNFSRDPRDAINRFIAFAIPFGSVANEEQLQRGLHVAISDTVRIPPTSVDPTIKNYHWLDLIKGLYDAYDQHAETALVLDCEGNIAEGPGFNVFAVSNGCLTTPARNVLPGITRRSVMDICKELDIGVWETTVRREDLFAADEIFITSTAGGVMPVTKINNRPIGTGHVGEITKTLNDEYWKRHSDPKWSTPIEYFS
ncbi:aminotransferase class IV [Agrobacterium fabrum]|uniref:aminotransferase class IV n=1 Tax=Agrobacterium fabrum TaxID=1176649 RepID=UPI003B9F0E97